MGRCMDEDTYKLLFRKLREYHKCLDYKSICYEKGGYANEVEPYVIEDERLVTRSNKGGNNQGSFSMHNNREIIVKKINY